MKTFKLLAIAIAAVALLAATDWEAFAQCSQRGQTVVETIVYDRKPVFYTGKGWQMGGPVATLPPDTPVTICEEAEIGVLFDKKKWYRIQFGAQASGWAFSGHIRTSGGSSGAVSAPWSLLSAAHASDVSLPLEDGLPSNTKFYLYLTMFLVTVIGMFGKAAFDEINSSEAFSLKKCLNGKNCIKAIIVAPIVFLTFLKTADFSSASGEAGFLIAVCLAFQNGFFWQTVLPSKGVLKRSSAVSVTDA
ncbi:MAG: hypothetical protein WAU91_12570 [Desulfatitalea sp.]